MSGLDMFPYPMLLPRFGDRSIDDGILKVFVNEMFEKFPETKAKILDAVRQEYEKYIDSNDFKQRVASAISYNFRSEIDKAVAGHKDEIIDAVDAHLDESLLSIVAIETKEAVRNNMRSLLRKQKMTKAESNGV